MRAMCVGPIPSLALIIVPRAWEGCLHCVQGTRVRAKECDEFSHTPRNDNDTLLVNYLHGMLYCISRSDSTSYPGGPLYTVVN